MALDGQFDRMVALYSEKSDEELEQLYAAREDLTEVAEQALTDVLHKRGIAPRTQALSPLLEERRDDADPANSPLAQDEVCLYTFDDAFRTTEALRLLDRADIPARVIDWNAISDQTRERRPTLQLGVVVKRLDQAAASHILQEELGLLLPLKGNSDFMETHDFVPVARLERADALVLAHALGTHGISYLWTDDRDDASAGADLVAIEVRAERIDRANKLMDQVLGV